MNRFKVQNVAKQARNARFKAYPCSCCPHGPHPLRLGFAIVNIDKAHSCALSKYILALCRAYNGTLPPLRDVDAHKVEGKAPKGA